jgi:thioredoxin-like negative regulator of GroEL
MINRCHTIALADDNFPIEVERSPTPVIVNFYANWCSMSGSISALSIQLQQEFDRPIALSDVDVAACPQIARSCQIRAVPTLVIFDRGQIIYRVIGSPDLTEIIQHLNSIFSSRISLAYP